MRLAKDPPSKADEDKQQVEPGIRAGTPRQVPRHDAADGPAQPRPARVISIIGCPPLQITLLFLRHSPVWSPPGRASLACEGRDHRANLEPRICRGRWSYLLDRFSITRRLGCGRIEPKGRAKRFGLAILVACERRASASGSASGVSCRVRRPICSPAGTRPRLRILPTPQVPEGPWGTKLPAEWTSRRKVTPLPPARSRGVQRALWAPAAKSPPAKWLVRLESRILGC